MIEKSQVADHNQTDHVELNNVDPYEATSIPASKIIEEDKAKEP